MTLKTLLKFWFSCVKPYIGKYGPEHRRTPSRNCRKLLAAISAVGSVVLALDVRISPFSDISGDLADTSPLNQTKLAFLR